MGSLLKTDQRSQSQKKHMTKGQRLGWKHASDCQPLSLRKFSPNGETLIPYIAGPFAANKLVP